MLRLLYKDDRDFFQHRIEDDTPVFRLRGVYRKAPDKGRIIEEDMEQLKAFAKQMGTISFAKLQTEPVIRPCNYYNLSTCSWKNVQKHQIVNKQGHSVIVHHVCAICYGAVNAHMAHEAKVCPNARIKYE